MHRDNVSCSEFRPYRSYGLGFQGEIFQALIAAKCSGVYLEVLLVACCKGSPLEGCGGLVCERGKSLGVGIACEREGFALPGDLQRPGCKRGLRPLSLRILACLVEVQVESNSLTFPWDTGQV